MSTRKRTEEVLAEHATTFVDRDGDTRCDCGKWLEPGEHEWPTHVAWMLDEAGVLSFFAEQDLGAVVSRYNEETQ